MVCALPTRQIDLVVVSRERLVKSRRLGRNVKTGGPERKANLRNCNYGNLLVGVVSTDLNTRYQDFVAAVERAINEADPIGLLEMGAPADEYSPEIGTILPRLAAVERVDDVTDVLHEEFLRWFDHGIAGPRDAYEAPARRIWDALLEYRKSDVRG